MKNLIIILLAFLLIMGVVGCGYTPGTIIPSSQQPSKTDLVNPSPSKTELASPSTSKTESLNYKLSSVSNANCQLIEQSSGVVRFKPQYCAYNCDYVQLDFTEFSADLRDNKSLFFTALIYWYNYPIQECSNFLHAKITNKDEKMATITIQCKGSMFSPSAQTYNFLYLTYISE